MFLHVFEHNFTFKDLWTIPGTQLNIFFPYLGFLPLVKMVFLKLFTQRNPLKFEKYISLLLKEQKVTMPVVGAR